MVVVLSILALLSGFVLKAAPATASVSYPGDVCVDARWVGPFSFSYMEEVGSRLIGCGKDKVTFKGSQSKLQIKLNKVIVAEGSVSVACPEDFSNSQMTIAYTSYVDVGSNSVKVGCKAKRTYAKPAKNGASAPATILTSPAFSCADGLTIVRDSNGNLGCEKTQTQAERDAQADRLARQAVDAVKVANAENPQPPGKWKIQWAKDHPGEAWTIGTCVIVCTALLGFSWIRIHDDKDPMGRPPRESTATPMQDSPSTELVAGVNVDGPAYLSPGLVCGAIVLPDTTHKNPPKSACGVYLPGSDDTSSGDSSNNNGT
jgi:hypothetical protein